MLGEDGIYPPGLQPGRDLLTFRDAGELPDLIDRVLLQPDERVSIARSGLETVRQTYSKARQWRDFLGCIDLL